MYFQRFLYNNASKDLLTVFVMALKCRRTIRNKDLLKYSTAPLILQKYIHNSFVLKQDKQQYEYDSKTDTFRPKSQQSFTNPSLSRINSFKSNNNKEKSSLTQFLRRWIRNVFLITGGIVWGGIIFATLFVDVKETAESPVFVHDMDNDARMLAFYDIGLEKDDLSTLISSIISNGKKDGTFPDDLNISIRDKQHAFMDAMFQIKRNKKVEELLGKPVQMCGIRAAKKLLLEEFKDFSAIRSAESNIDDSFSDKWTAEFVLEGSQAVTSVVIEFERIKDKEWKVEKVTLEMPQTFISCDIDINGS